MVTRLEGHEIVKEIEGDENKRRKAMSFQQSEIYAGRLDQYVKEYIQSRYGKSAMTTMPIMSSINIARRIINKSATLYLKEPIRTFTNCTKKTVDLINETYRDMNFNHHMKMANKMFKAQEQHIMQVVPMDGKLVIRNFKMHNIDAIESELDPEKADAYITSSFDRDLYQRNMGGDLGLIAPNTNYRDMANQKIADKDDFKKRLKRFVFWTKDENFIIDGEGSILSEETINNLGVLPFVEISLFKDNEFFVRAAGDLYDFTIQLNAALSSLWLICDLQGFAVGYLISTDDVMPENLIVGPTKILKLRVSEENPSVRPEFGFTSPSADLAGGRDFIDLLLSLFLTSRGIDAKAINTKGETESYTSGLDRFLAHIEKFQASEDDIYVMEKAEKEMFELIKKIINNTSNTNLLGPKYSFTIPENAELQIEYAKPEIVKTDSDLVELWIRKIENDLGSIVDAVKDIYKINTDKEAIELIKKWKDVQEEIKPPAPMPIPIVEVEEEEEETE